VCDQCLTTGGSAAGGGTATDPVCDTSPVGTPDANGQATIAYTVQDLAFSTVSPLPDATRNVAYSTTLQTTGGRHRKPHFRGY
jgi:hypothetical protein